MRRAFEDWLAGECALRPVMLVLEDLHWGDLPTVRLVESALRNLAGRQLFVLALARPEVEETFPKLWSDVSLQGAGVQHIVLAPLGRRASEALVRDALGPGPSDELVAAVAARAGGNVFYLEELVRVASEGGKELPDTVLAMVQARTLALEPDVRRVLRAASVFGRRFWRGGVVALLGGPRSATLLDEWLGDLEEGELVTVQRESRFPGEREYVFRHDLVREAAYAMLTEDDRSLGHKLAAGWLEAAGEVQALPLAEHFERGGEGARAAAFYARAAIDALEGNDFAAAIDRTRRGVACGATGTLRGTLLRLRAEAHKWRAELEDSMGCALAAIDLLPLGTAAYFDAVADLAAACGRLGRPDVLAPVAESLEWVTPTLDARSRFVVAAAAVVVQRVYGGDAIGGARMRAKLDEVAARLPDDPVAQAWTHRVRSFTGLYAGDVSTYLVEGREAAACFDRVGDLRAATTLRAAVGYAHMQLGQWEEAERVLRASRAVAERMGLQTIITLVKHNLGMTLGRLGRWEEGKAMEAESVAESTAQRDRRIEAPARTYLAVLQLESGDPATALSTAEAAAKVADEGRPFALGVQADALLALGDLDGALARAMESQRVQLAVRGAGEEEGTLLALIVHAEALDRLGRRDEAREVLRKATRELATRAERIADPKWRESYVERVPVHVRIRARAREWAT
jgi:tetratricopeptide (TPR) repeat protein